MKRALALVAVPALAISLAACADDSGDAKGPRSPGCGSCSSGSGQTLTRATLDFGARTATEARRAWNETCSDGVVSSGSILVS